ncbi:hypothetical protein BI023_gp57 [Mycobacterium phage Sneeze]|uniref:Uncharacterized protein n=1 Tax=Mycobacterium phage Rabbs TaxID=2530143 RepID=A0A481VSJ1_9CAUD|nr:hypothetical protein BI023_gp57 [Mycobacterium phage Sneeze]YP_010051403.1 hypothetical protein KDW71_gp58 [Mycobacterium phage Rabbs]ANU79763.1 hypothetical protein SEA_SNEEZE_57 [Mycobacterium phage Sneeze]QBI96809.1 hypothetical protein SEA_RABBS_58 [Mycobacterium phage Rabbs]
MDNAPATKTQTFSIEAESGKYGPFDTYAEARRYQREWQLTGSSVVPN